jgi:hypothetical protein
MFFSFEKAVDLIRSMAILDSRSDELANLVVSVGPRVAPLARRGMAILDSILLRFHSTAVPSSYPPPSPHL